MPLDPHLAKIGQAGPFEQRALQKLADLENRIRSLESSKPGIQQIAGTPTTVARNGTAVVDSTAIKLWLRVGGTWRFTTLT